MAKLPQDRLYTHAACYSGDCSEIRHNENDTIESGAWTVSLKAG